MLFDKSMVKNTYHILLIEDNPGDARLFKEMLKDAGRASFSLDIRETLAAGVDYLSKNIVDIVLLDLTLPDSKGIDTLKKMLENHVSIPVVILSGLDDEQTALEAVKIGAQDYLIKGEIDTPLLTRALRYAIERHHGQLQLYNAIIKAEEEKAKQKAYEKELKRLARQNELLLNTAGEGIVGLDNNCNHIFVNPAAAELLGYAPFELIGKNAHDVWHHSREDGSPYPKEECPIHSSLQDGIIRRLDEEVFWRKDGTSFPVEYISTPIKEEGEITGAVVTFMDITERKWSEMALIESEERYRDLFENANDLIMSISAKGRFLYVNKAWCEVLGYEEDEVSNFNITDVIHPDNNLPVEQIFSATADNKKVEVSFITRNGDKIIAEGSIGAKFVEGKHISSRGIFRDITARKAAEKEKEELQARFLQSQKMEAIGTLAGGVAHDFNNLLTTIQGYTDLAIKATAENESLKNDLMAVRSACERASGIVRQLLLFSRVQTMEFKSVNLNQLIINLFKMIDRIIGEDITVELDLSEDLASVCVDSGNIEQVIMNLTVNARDAMPDGGKLSITTEKIFLDNKKIGCEKACNYIRLSVRDTGQGMDEDVVSHIFEPFYTTKEVGKGTGLGLAVVYGIIEQHNGGIEVISRKNRGTVFHIYLPLGAVECECEESILVNLDLMTGNGEKILLVEDEEVLRNLSSTVLQKNGYSVYAAGTGDEARQIFEKEKGDFYIFFCDVVLPDTNGLKLAEIFTRTTPNLKVLLTSGYEDQKAQIPAISEKNYSFIPKPYSISELLKSIKR